MEVMSESSGEILSGSTNALYIETSANGDHVTIKFTLERQIEQ